MFVAVLLTGLGAGAGGVLLTLLLHAIQHLVCGYTENSFLTGVERASPARRVLALTLGGLIVGLGWWAQRRHLQADVSVSRALADPVRPLPFADTVVDCVLQIVAVAFGASLGREGAPRQLGAATGAWLGARLRVTARQRRTLLACGAGAGLAAVYNVPLGGAVFTLEILLASSALGEVVPALLTCGIATVVAWPVLSDHPTYQVGALPLRAGMLVWALLAGPAAGLAATGFVRLMSAAAAREPTGWRLPVSVTAVFAALGVVAIGYPQLLGNGRGAAQLALDSSVSLPLLAVLLIGKPLATAGCLAGGARGGLLTPALATGALFGALTGGLWAHLWPGAPLAGDALVGAAAVLATTQRAPLTAIVLVLEFTHSGLSLLAPLVLAVGLAVLTGVALNRPRRGSEIAAGGP